jgi:hypothetical protein
MSIGFALRASPSEKSEVTREQAARGRAALFITETIKFAEITYITLLTHAHIIAIANLQYKHGAL